MGRNRGDRRNRTETFARRELKRWLSFGYKDRPLGEFAKTSALSCRCTRKKGSPRVAYGCTYGGFCYNPSLVERIAGNRLTRKWLRELQGSAPEDVDL